MNEDNLDESVDSMEAKARRNRRTKKKLEQLMLSSGKPPLGDIRRFSQDNYNTISTYLQKSWSFARTSKTVNGMFHRMCSPPAGPMGSHVVKPGIRVGYRVACKGAPNPKSAS
ncbi:hypothetical protein GGI11_008766, partial [Coemansia sp. RSA 2049]